MKPIAIITCVMSFFASSGYALSEEYLLEIPTDSMAQHYVLAVEKVGKSLVQIENRRVGKYETLYGVLVANCRKRTVRRIYEGEVPPPVFPVQSEKSADNPLIEGSMQWFLARHACEKAGINGGW